MGYKKSRIRIFFKNKKKYIISDNINKNLRFNGRI